MDAKLEKLLMMALRSDTNDHEADAAFRAARRMSKGQDVHKLLSSGVTTVVEKVVYRTREEGSFAREFILHIPPSYQFSMMERVFKDGDQHDVHVQMLKCDGQKSNITSGLRLEIRVSGTKQNVQAYSTMLDGYIAQIKNSRTTNKQGARPAQAEKPPAADASPKKGFWSKLFGK